MRLKHLLIIATLLVAGLLIPPGSTAQEPSLCFDVPGITSCIAGRFREYWQQNGGLAVFGYPISPATMQQTAEGTFLTQYFERNRFELHPEKAPPYDVLLGRLGDDRLKQQGHDWFAFPKGQQTPGCLWFAETGHSVCDQEAGVGFRSYWEGHGLQDAGLSGFARSLALFGLPLSEPTVETNAAGATVVTQWFERARLEWHPGNPREFKVLLGLLGNETRGTGEVATPVPSPTPTPAPTPTPVPSAVPTPGCANIAPPVDAAIEPNCVRAGEAMVVGVFGFDANSEVAIWITEANGQTIGSNRTIRVNDEGNFIGVIDTGQLGLAPGDYVFVAQDIENKYRPSTAPFRVLP